MPSAQNAQALPPIDPGLRPDYYRTMLPNLSYPYCSISHILCSNSSAPLVFSKTTRLEMATPTITSSVQAPTTAKICFDTCSVPDVFQGISVWIWHNLTMIVEKLKLIRLKLFAFRFMSPPTSASV